MFDLIDEWGPEKIVCVAEAMRLRGRLPQSHQEGGGVRI
jgi:hypothetical protein